MDGRFIESRIYETPKTYEAVKCLCYEAKEMQLASVQVFPCMIGICKKILDNTPVKINALISYPHGGFSIEQKAAEAKEAVEAGAEEIEAVVNTREIKSHNYDFVLREMSAVKKALPENIVVKFIIEMECLTGEEAAETARVAAKAGIDYISTSTGLYHALDSSRNDVTLYASAEDVKLLKDACGGKVKVQSVGYVDTPELAQSLIDAGADLVSTEFAAAVMGR